MADVVWRPRATDELREIVHYIHQFDPTAATGIGSRLFDLGNSLAVFPRRGRVKSDTIREMTTVPPYILEYTIEDGTVFILSVHHGARRPLR